MSYGTWTLLITRAIISSTQLTLRHSILPSGGGSFHVRNAAGLLRLLAQSTIVQTQHVLASRLILHKFLLACILHLAPLTLFYFALPLHVFCLCHTHDNTARDEFMMFDKVAREIIGKPAMSLLRRRYPGYAMFQEIAQVAKNDPTSPPEITRILGQKFKFVVSISSKSFGPNNRELSFQVNRIVEAFKPELATTPFVHPAEVPTSPSSSSADIPLAGSAVLTPRKPSATPIARAPLLTENCDPTHMSPPLEPPTPQFALAGGPSPSLGTGKIACPCRGARTSLFSTSPKANKGANEENTSTSADPNATSVTG